VQQASPKYLIGLQVVFLYFIIDQDPVTNSILQQEIGEFMLISDGAENS
jgi:hypothetical protein